MNVLLVEHDVKIAATVKRGLEAGDLSVRIVFAAGDAFRVATENEFDAIVADVRMPGRKAFELCSQLREAHVWTPILALCGEESGGIEALNVGADAFVTEPFSSPGLMAGLRALIQRTTGRRPASLRVGDLRLYPGQQSVSRAGAEIELTSRQFDVLEFLMQRPGQVMSRSEILSGVWEHDFVGDPGIVDVVIRRLRRRIDDPSHRRVIETVRGAGYRLATDVEHCANDIASHIDRADGE